MSQLDALTKRVSAIEASHETLHKLVTKRFENYDRRDQIGCLVVQGKGLPVFVKNEKLSDLVISLALKHLSIKVAKDDISFVRRIAIKKTAPVLIK